jgi:hypothetical protein
MAAAMKAHNLVGADPGPMLVPLVRQCAGDVECAPPVILLKHRSADSGRAFGDIVECEADHRTGVWQLKRYDGKMPGQPVADARSECRPSWVQYGTFARSDKWAARRANN